MLRERGFKGEFRRMGGAPTVAIARRSIRLRTFQHIHKLEVFPAKTVKVSGEFVVLAGTRSMCRQVGAPPRNNSLMPLALRREFKSMTDIRRG